MIHFLLEDEDFPRPAVIALRELGHDVLTLRSLGKDDIGYPDDEVSKTAIETNRAVLTYNRKDYIRLHRETSGNHSGIVICTRFRDNTLLANRINEKIKHIDNLCGKLIRVTRPNKP